MKTFAPALAALALAATASQAPAALAIGMRAPSFSTQAAVGGRPFAFDLQAALARGPVVLYFFPAAFTPGCTLEAHAFAEAADEFNQLGATVVGLSADPIDKLQRFSVEECRNKFAVGTATPQVIGSFDVVLPQRNTLSNRTSYVIAPDGKIIYVHSDMSPAGHITGTLAAVRDWRAAHPR